jgi:hypothetical protein
MKRTEKIKEAAKKVREARSVNKQPKKELSGVIEPVIAPEDYVLACIDCATHMIWDQRLVIKRDEYDRLKRLDENIKKEIKELKGLCCSYETYGVNNSAHHKQCKKKLKLLESLYK